MEKSSCSAVRYTRPGGHVKLFISANIVGSPLRCGAILAAVARLIIVRDNFVPHLAGGKLLVV
jgi:hypothetical protein